MGWWQVIFATLVITISQCLCEKESESIYTQHGPLDLTETRMSNRENDKLNETKSNCMCFTDNKSNITVPNHFKLDGGDLERLVVYLYRSKINEDTSIYIPNNEKQSVFPDLHYDGNDVILRNAGSETVNDILKKESYFKVLAPMSQFEQPHAALLPDKGINSHIITIEQQKNLPFNTLESISNSPVNNPYNQQNTVNNEDPIINNFINSDNINMENEVNLNDEILNKLFLNKQKSKNIHVNLMHPSLVIEKDNDFSIPSVASIENPVSHFSVVNYIHPMNKSELNQYTTNKNSSYYHNNVNYTSSNQFNEDPKTNLMKPNYQSHTENFDFGKKIPNSNYLQDLVSKDNYNSTSKINYAKYPKINPLNLQSYNYLYPYLKDITLNNVTGSDKSFLFPNNSNHRTQKFLLPVQLPGGNIKYVFPTEQKLLEFHKNIKLSFEQWLQLQIRLLEMQANIAFSPSDVNEMRIHVKTFLKENEITESGEGNLLDSNGNIFNMSNLLLHPVLMTGPENARYLEIILVNFSNRPKIIGIIPLGKSTLTQNWISECTMEGCKLKFICTYYKCLKEIKLDYDIANRVKKPINWSFVDVVIKHLVQLPVQDITKKSFLNIFPLINDTNSDTEDDIQLFQYNDTSFSKDIASIVFPNEGNLISHKNEKIGSGSIKNFSNRDITLQNIILNDSYVDADMKNHLVKKTRQIGNVFENIGYNPISKIFPNLPIQIGKELLNNLVAPLNSVTKNNKKYIKNDYSYVPGVYTIESSNRPLRSISNNFHTQSNLQADPSERANYQTFPKNLENTRHIAAPINRIVGNNIDITNNKKDNGPVIFVMDSIPEVLYDQDDDYEDLDVRILGGKAAISSGTPLSYKGRSG